VRVLIVDDERNIRESLQRLLALDGIDSAAAADGREALSLLGEEAFDAVVTDLRMPGMGGQELLERIIEAGLRCPVIMISALGEIKDAVKAIKSGASDYLLKPFEPDELVRRLVTAVDGRRMGDRLEADKRGERSSRLLGRGGAYQALAADIERMARADAPVLITGESGTGKELVAREVHALSPRAPEPFVAVNVGGIHEHLMESELFGHEKGAFTGAEARKVGLFELAGSGTIFLDEIGEMPPRLQVKLLRVLQERKIRRLGGTRDLPVAARIISATNRDVEALVRDGGFREDLYYRINVLRIRVPPLRERRDDIPLLAESLLAALCARMGRGSVALEAGALERLAAYDYPGNVRELENLLERALIYCEGGVVRASDLGLPATRVRPGRLDGDSLDGLGEERAAPREGEAASLEELERAAIEGALFRCGGNRSRAARELGISRRTILYRLKRWGLGGDQES